MRCPILPSRMIPTAGSTVSSFVSRPTPIIVDAFPIRDRKSTRLNSSHANISYAVFCLKKKILYSLTYLSSPNPHYLPSFLPFLLPLPLSVLLSSCPCPSSLHLLLLFYFSFDLLPSISL